MPKDKLGREFIPGQWVARPTNSFGSSAALEIRKIVKVENGKVYLASNKPTALRYHGELVILAQPNDDLAIELESKFK